MLEKVSQKPKQLYHQPTLPDIAGVVILMTVSVWATGAILGWW